MDIPLHRPYMGLMYGRYLQFRFLKWPLNMETHHSIKHFPGNSGSNRSKAHHNWCDCPPLRQCHVELPGEGPPLGLRSQPTGDTAAGCRRCERGGERLRKDGPMAKSQADLGAVEVPEGPHEMGYAGFLLIINTQPNLWNFMSKNRFRNLIGEIWGFMRQELQGARWD